MPERIRLRASCCAIIYYSFHTCGLYCRAKKLPPHRGSDSVQGQEISCGATLLAAVPAATLWGKLPCRITAASVSSFRHEAFRAALRGSILTAPLSVPFPAPGTLCACADGFPPASSVFCIVPQCAAFCKRRSVCCAVSDCAQCSLPLSVQKLAPQTLDTYADAG